MKRISDIMNTNVITIEADLSFDKVLEIMREKGVGKLPVIDGGELVGVVTRDDVLVRQESAPLPPVVAFWDLLITLPKSKEFKEKLKKLSAYSAKDLMTKKYKVVGKNDELSSVVDQIVEQNYNFVIVVEKDSVEGIITKTDLINKSF